MILATRFTFIVERSGNNMYFHPKLAWTPATYDVTARNHSNWPSLNLSQNVCEGWINSYENARYWCFILQEKTQKHLMYVRGLIAGLPRARSARGTDPHTHGIWSTSFRLLVTWLTERTYVRTYARVYRLYGWGRGDYQKEGRGISGVSWQAHIFNIGH